MNAREISLSQSSAEEIVEMFIGMIREIYEMNGWHWVKERREDRQQVFISAIIPALVDLRDKKMLVLDYEKLGWFLDLDRVLYLRDDEAIGGYLRSLPEFDEVAGIHQSELTRSVHETSVEKLRRTLTVLAAADSVKQSDDLGQGWKCAVRRTLKPILPLHIQDRLSAMFTKSYQWVAYQFREIWREIKRAIRPPVTVRPHGRNVLAISTRPEFGSGVLLMPMSGSAGVVGATWSTATNEPGYGVEVWSETPSGRDVWPVGRFPDRETAEHVVELICKPLTGSSWGKWVFRIVLLWLALILVRAWFNAPSPAAVGIDPANAAPAPTEAALMGLFGGSGGTPAMPPGLTALAAGTQHNAGTESLADEIYNAAMAQSRQAMHEQGPPQSPAPDTGLKSFGLSGGTTGEGCDPKLAFKVGP